MDDEHEHELDIVRDTVADESQLYVAYVEASHLSFPVSSPGVPLMVISLIDCSIERKLSVIIMVIMIFYFICDSVRLYGKH